MADPVPLAKRTPQDLFDEIIRRFDSMDLTAEHQLGSLSDYAHIQTLIQFATLIKLDEMHRLLGATSEKWKELNRQAGEAISVAKKNISQEQLAKHGVSVEESRDPNLDLVELANLGWKLLEDRIVGPDGKEYFESMAISSSQETGDITEHRGEVVRGNLGFLYLRVGPEESISIANLFQELISHNVTIWTKDNGLADRPTPDDS